jgi:transposase
MSVIDYQTGETYDISELEADEVKAFQEDDSREELALETLKEEVKEKWLIQYSSSEIKDLDSIEFEGTKEEADRLAMRECPEVPCSWSINKIN